MQRRGNGKTILRYGVRQYLRGERSVEESVGDSIDSEETGGEEG